MYSTNSSCGEVSLGGIRLKHKWWSWSEDKYIPTIQLYTIQIPLMRLLYHFVFSFIKSLSFSLPVLQSCFSLFSILLLALATFDFVLMLYHTLQISHHNHIHVPYTGCNSLHYGLLLCINRGHNQSRQFSRVFIIRMAWIDPLYHCGTLFQETVHELYNVSLRQILPVEEQKE